MSVSVSHIGRVAVLTLNAPAKLNALSVVMGDAFEAAVGQVKRRGSEEVRCVVVTGAGDAFSAGGDLAFLQQRLVTAPETNAAEMRRYYARFMSLRKEIDVPTIAAINGVAVGAGFCLALTCDMRFAAESSKMGLNFLKLGIHPGMGATHFLPMLAGEQTAARMLFSARLIGAAEALRVGLVAETFPAEGFMDSVMERAQEIASASPIATRLTVQTLRAKQNVGLADALTRESDAQALCYAHGDLKEGLAAVVEKRSARF